VIVTGHRSVAYQQVIDRVPLVVDCCHATAGLQDAEENVVMLGVGAGRPALHASRNAETRAG
jgi:hypothetical protein